MQLEKDNSKGKFCRSDTGIELCQTILCAEEMDGLGGDELKGWTGSLEVEGFTL